MKLIKLLAIAVLLSLGSAAANAATVWAPTNEDSDFVVGAGTDLNGADLYFFDAGSFGVGGINLGSTADTQVVFSFSAGTYTATGSSFTLGALGAINLGTDNWFELGVSFDGGTTFVGDVQGLEVQINADTVQVTFNNGGASASIQGVDIVHAVPVPAAVWLFGSGLIGLVGVARRRRA